MDKYFKILLDLLLNTDEQLTSLDIHLLVSVMERFAFEGEGWGACTSTFPVPCAAVVTGCSGTAAAALSRTAGFPAASAAV